MRKIAFLAAVAATLCTVACNKDFSGNAGTEMPQPQEEERYEVEVSITGGMNAITKSSDSSFDADHSVVSNIQFFVFNRDQELEVYKKITDGLSTTLTLRKGANTLWAVVNAPDISNVSTLTQLKAVSSSLSDNLSNFVMVGSKLVNYPNDDEEGGVGPISVERLASRVVVKKVTAAFINPTYAAATCKLKKMYLINAPGGINFGLDAPTVWYAKRAYEEVSGLVDFLSTSGGEHDLNTAPFTTTCYHYCYPNSTSSDTSAATWSPRHTRMVIEVELDSETFYYPITLPVLQHGKSYEIENLTITRKGSTNPDEPVSVYDVNFNVEVKPWTVVPVTAGTTI